jgi:hypothetical protein
VLSSAARLAGDSDSRSRSSICPARDGSPMTAWPASNSLPRRARGQSRPPPANRPFRVGVEQPQIRNKMGHVVARQKRLVRSGVGNLWRLRHAEKATFYGTIVGDRQVWPAADRIAAWLHETALRLFPDSPMRKSTAPAKEHSTEAPNKPTKPAKN